MTLLIFFLSLLINIQSNAAPSFIKDVPLSNTKLYEINGHALCNTAKETLAYLNKGYNYDPSVIHDGNLFNIPLKRVKETLVFICQNKNKLSQPKFINDHFDFIRWYPDISQTKSHRSNKSLVAKLPNDKILMTKYYVHLAQASSKKTSSYPFAIYALPKDEESLSIEEANTKSNLIRFKYGKQAILKGALDNKNVPVLAYLNREDLEAALMQGTIVVKFNDDKNSEKILNVNRNNNIAYDKAKNPYNQERYWYFKQVDGIKGYGKDAQDKITVNSEVTFAADLEQFGLGKLLMVQYLDQKGKLVTRAGIFADTGGAFKNNQYQIDYLSGSYAGKDAFYRANSHLPNYVTAYFMVLKNNLSETN